MSETEASVVPNYKFSVKNVNDFKSRYEVVYKEQEVSGKQKLSKSQLSYQLILNGKIIKKVKLEDEDTTIEIRKIQSETDIQPSYTASWKDDSKIYQISCKMEEEEFIKLIEGIRF